MPPFAFQNLSTLCFHFWVCANLCINHFMLTTLYCCWRRLFHPSMCRVGPRCTLCRCFQCHSYSAGILSGKWDLDCCASFRIGFMKFSFRRMVADTRNLGVWLIPRPTSDVAAYDISAVIKDLHNSSVMIHSPCFESLGRIFTSTCEITFSTEFGAKSDRADLCRLNSSQLAAAVWWIFNSSISCLTSCLALGCGSSQRKDSGPGTKVCSFFINLFICANSPFRKCDGKRKKRRKSVSLNLSLLFVSAFFRNTLQSNFFQKRTAKEFWYVSLLLLLLFILII